MKPSYSPSLSLKDTSVTISKLGIKKANTKVWQLLLLGVLAGLYIGFGGQLFLVALASGMGKIAGAALFSVGLILVIVAGAELFTGNVVILIGVLSGAIPRRRMLKNWFMVYVGNFVGSLIFVWLMYESGLFGSSDSLNDLGVKAVKVAEYKLAIPFTQAVIRGVLCNILVILAIIMAIIAKDIVSKILCIVFPITCFVACGFEHCIANMYLIPIGLMLKGVPLGEMHVIFNNIIPVTIGNIIGGFLILVVHPNRIRQLRFLFRRS